MKLITMIRGIVGMRNTQMDDLARNIAFYDLAKAEILERMLNVYIREELEKRQAWKEAA